MVEAIVGLRGVAQFTIAPVWHGIAGGSSGSNLVTVSSRNGSVVPVVVPELDRSGRHCELTKRVYVLMDISIEEKRKEVKSDTK